MRTFLPIAFLLAASSILMSACNGVSPTTRPVDLQRTPWANADTLQFCPSICNRGGFFGIRSQVPLGFMVYDRPGRAGVWVQNTEDKLPLRVPNTGGDKPLFIYLSDNGKWIFYLEAKSGKVNYITPLGTGKGLAPIAHVKSGYPTFIGMYRNSPMGSEFFYVADSISLRAVKFLERDGHLQFLDDRLLLDLNGNPLGAYIAQEQLAITNNQILGKIFFPRDGRTSSINAHISIPQAGMGVARWENVYRWKTSPPDLSGNCGHAMSRDGRYTLANPGGVYRDSLENCLPLAHKGFYIAPFCSGQDSLDARDFPFAQGISINWCPPEYRGGLPPRRNDFYRWDFGNSNDYVLGRLSGPESDFHGIWLIEWRTNTWTLLTPKAPMILADFIGIHFGKNLDYRSFAPDTLLGTLVSGPPTIDLNDPGYEVLYPNGGEVLLVGDTCEVSLLSYRDADAVVFITFDGRSFMLPGLVGSINPRLNSTLTFKIPDGFLDCPPGSGCTKVSAIGRPCKLLVEDYAGGYYRDYSDGSFIIKHP